jgi:anhydro-N-acetylmuramic acid kinase
LAERTGIDVICDFRSRDVAAGGEGAPLVPAFHAAQFAQAGRSRAVLNLGGIANLTLLGRDGSVLGFDTGPGNVLMDLWCASQFGHAYDAGGARAASGQVVTPLLQTLLAEPYFQRSPPKSTGRDLFDASWLHSALSDTAREPADVMATLAELTARSVTNDLQRYAPDIDELIVCGGGAFNSHLMQRLRAGLQPAVVIRTSADHGLPPDQVEAMAFAWLASAFVDRRTGNLPAVTGARGARILGALYPAG